MVVAEKVAGPVITECSAAILEVIRRFHDVELLDVGLILRLRILFEGEVFATADHHAVRFDLAFNAALNERPRYVYPLLLSVDFAIATSITSWAKIATFAAPHAVMAELVGIFTIRPSGGDGDDDEERSGSKHGLGDKR